MAPRRPARRAKIIDRTGRFLVPVVYRLRTPDGEPVNIDLGEGIPNCRHCGQPVPLRPEPDPVPTPVVTDTREQLYYTFEGIGWDAKDGGGVGQVLAVETVAGTLASGDYSLLGYEDRAAVERKSLADLYATIGQGRDRFERELERLAEMEFAAVVIEATWPEVCADPPDFTRLPPKTVFRSIVAWQVRYGVHFIPAGPRRLAEVTTFRLLERFLREDLEHGKSHLREGHAGAGEA